jgi:tetratricopeptide (TPR) repeat protein
VDHYQKALALDRKNTFALGGLADAYRGKDRIKDAVETWKRFLDIDPDNPHVLNRLADAHQSGGHWEEALACYDRILRKAPRDRSALAAKYRLLFLSENHDEEKKAVESLLREIDPELLKSLILRTTGDSQAHAGPPPPGAVSESGSSNGRGDESRPKGRRRLRTAASRAE